MAQVRTRSIRGTMVVSPTGSLDAASSRDFQAAVLGLIEQGERWLAVDLKHAPQVTGTAIGALLTVRRKIESQTGGLVLCGLSTTARRALDVVGVAGRFRVASSLLAGLRLLRREQDIKALADRVAQLLTSSETRDVEMDSQPGTVSGEGP